MSHDTFTQGGHFPDMGLAVAALDEIRAINEAGPTVPAENTDMVWVLSAHGTYDEPGRIGAYTGTSYDRLSIDAGVGLVTQIAADRAGKELADVTPEDIEEFGPTLFYNGEDSKVGPVTYDQNKHMRQAVASGRLALPASRVIIDPIETNNTPGQMEGLARYLDEVAPNISNIAVVSTAVHAPRVGRYLNHYAPSFKGVNFASAPIAVPAEVPMMQRVVMVRGELYRIVHYAAQGDLSRGSYFHPASTAA